MELVRSSLSIVGGLPREKVGSAPVTVFSGPAQRSLTLWPARSPSRLATLYIESSDSFVASAAVSIATGWSEPVPGRELHPLKSSAFSRRTVTPTERCPPEAIALSPTDDQERKQRLSNPIRKDLIFYQVPFAIPLLQHPVSTCTEYSPVAEQWSAPPLD
jgi:hypothetical protein